MSFWLQRWGHAQTLVILFGLGVVSCLLEFFSEHQGLVIPPFPTNLYLMFAFVGLGLVIYFLPVYKFFKDWLLSRPFVVWTVSGFGFFVMLAGFIPQGRQQALMHESLARWGLFHITEGYPFALFLFLIALSLLIVSIKKIHCFSKRDIAALCNHLGLLIVILVGALGSSDRQRLLINLHQGEPAWQGSPVDFPSRKIDLPFALKMEEFIVQEHTPELVLIDDQDNVIQPCGHLDDLPSPRVLCTFKNHEIELVSLMLDGFKLEDRFVAAKHIGSTIVAELRVYDQEQAATARTGRVVAGSMLIATEFFNLQKGVRLAIPIPKVKKFTTSGHFYTPAGRSGVFQLEVNRPFELEGWKLYQYGYDEKMGKWSTLSIVEAIYDPWLYGVYSGMGLMILGVLLLAWNPQLLGGKLNA